MASSLSVRNLDEAVVSRLKIRAARHGRSAEAEARAILTAATEAEGASDFERLAAEMRRLTAGRHHTPSEDLQREGRSER